MFRKVSQFKFGDRAIKKIKFTLLLLTIILAGANQADSADFGSNTDIITNPWLGLTNVGDGYTLAGYGDFEGAIRTFSLIGNERVLGVKCLILRIYGHGNNPVTEYYDVRIAQDTTANIRFLKATGVDGDGNNVDFDVNSPDEALIYLPATPIVGQRFDHLPGAYSEIIAVNQTVPKMSTGAGPYYDCMLRRWGGETGDTDDKWNCRYVGVVKEDWADEVGEVRGWWRVPDQIPDMNLNGEYWFGSLSADANSWVPWGKIGTVIINGNNWYQEWEDYDGHHSFSGTFTTSVQSDGSININHAWGSYNVAWNGSIMINADTAPDAENRLGFDIIARKATNIDVNDVIGNYSFFAHWSDWYERDASVGWGTVEFLADGNGVATWVYQDGREEIKTGDWTLDDVNGIMHIMDFRDFFLCEEGIIFSFTSEPGIKGDFGYHFFVKESNEPITPDDIAGTYIVRFLETSVFGQPFTCGKGTAVIRPDGTLEWDAYYSYGEHDVGEMTYALGPGNKISFPGSAHEEEGIISPDKSFIFAPELQVPTEPQWWNWIGGIFLVRTTCNIADLNVDRRVNFADYATFGNQWLAAEPGLSANFNRDSRVDWLDLKTFAENWLWQAIWLH
ncbi:MAG TPA: hypothetical protein HPP66_05505 [Planctomycetes bacterium]|nr:hypothetical protein [Planctomycetota bacterium]